MKKLTLFFLIFTFICFQKSFAQSSDYQRKNVLKANTLALIVGTGSIFYERYISDSFSGQMGVGYLDYRINDVSFSGLILTPEFRHYTSTNALNGFYIAPYLRFQRYSLENNSNNVNYNNNGGGLAFGYQWIKKGGFVMDLFFGGHYGNGKVSGNINNESFDTSTFEGFRTRIGFALGFAF